jgi:hypothetical protein
MTNDDEMIERHCDAEGPICPHCDRQFTADEPSYYENGTMECDECGKQFESRVDFSTSWTTFARISETKKDRDNG